MGALAVSCQPAQKQTASTLCTAEQFEAEMNKAENKIILDVRTPEEYAGGFITDARLYNIYDSDFSARIEKLDRETPVFVYCKAGGRSADAVGQLVSLGFKSVYDLKGGIMAWENSGRKIVNENSNPQKKIIEKKNHIYRKATLDSLISSGQPLLVNFYAKWCAPCKKMDPVLNKISSEAGNEKIIYRVDVDDAKQLCKDLKIEGPPVVKIYKGGKEISSVNGFQDESQCRALLKSIKD